MRARDRADRLSRETLQGVIEWELDALRQTVRWAVMLVETINAAPEPPRGTAPPEFPCERTPA